MNPTDFSIIYYCPEFGLKFYSLSKLQRVIALYQRVDNREVTIVEVENTEAPYYPYILGPV